MDSNVVGNFQAYICLRAKWQTICRILQFVDHPGNLLILAEGYRARVREWANNLPRHQYESLQLSIRTTLLAPTATTISLYQRLHEVTQIALADTDTETCGGETTQ